MPGSPTPRYSIIAALIVGVAVTACTGTWHRADHATSAVSAARPALVVPNDHRASGGTFRNSVLDFRLDAGKGVQGWSTTPGAIR